MTRPTRARPVLACTAAAMLTMLASGASAQSAPDQSAPEPFVAPLAPDPGAVAAMPVDAAGPALFEAGPIDEAGLAKVAGREDRPTWQASNAQSSATVRDNKVGDNSPTGALSVSDAAFQNVSGISMVNLNTGNASSINASMNVNVSIHMAPAPGGM